MRTILVLALLLMLVGTVAATVPTTDKSSATLAPMPPRLEWVRTRHGWERPVDWIVPVRQSATAHPWVVATLLGLASTLALVATSKANSRL